MDLKTCLMAARDAGELSPEAAKEYLDRLDELAGDGPDFHTSKVRQAQRLEGEILRKRDRKRRMKVKQAQRHAVLRERVLASSNPEKAALAILDFDPALKETGENVSMRYATIRGSAFALMSDFIDKYRSKFAGLKRETAGMRDVVKGLFGEETTPAGKELALAIQEARGFLVGRFNGAGGDIQMRKDWGWTQSHDRMAVSSATKEEWSEFILSRLDPDRMFRPDGGHMTAAELVRAVDASYESIVTGGLKEMGGDVGEKFGSPITARAAHRELAFRDATAWAEYHEKFGTGDIFSAIVGELDRMSREVALMEVLGPQPKAMLEDLKALIDTGRAAQAQALTGKAAAKAADKIGKHNFLEAVFDTVTGKINAPASSGFARFSQGNRNLVTAARLGSALFVSLADLGTNTLTARMNGMPIRKLLGEVFHQMNPANGSHRRMAARMGYIAEGWTGDLVAAQRLMGEVTGAPWTAKVADGVLRAGGLGAWTDGGRNAFSMELIGHMTDNAGKAFDEVEPVLLASLKRHGLTAEDWDLYRSTNIWSDPESGAEFIRPEDVWLETKNMAILPAEMNARMRTASRIGEFIHTESIFAVVAPTARSRAIATGGTTAGTFWGEAVRNLTLFRSFAVTHSYLHFSRMMQQRGITGKARYFAWLGISMTAAGAIAEQASDISRGKNPRDMDNPKFWGSAVIRGGSLGPLGDFLYSSTNRHGQNLAEGLLGPVLGGELLQGVKLTAGNVSELIQTGEAKNVGHELVQFAKGLTPGGSLWYSRVAFDRLIADEMTAMIDPNANERFRRIERRAQKEFDQKYWWSPGDRLPK